MQEHDSLMRRNLMQIVHDIPVSRKDLKIALAGQDGLTNSLISASIGLAQPLQSYGSRPIHRRACISRQEVSERATMLVGSLCKDIPVARAKTAEDFLRGLKQIFTHPSVLLGEAEITGKTLELERDALVACFEQQRPLEFTLLGFPHKMPNPLYTVATTPDMGEIIALKKLSTVMMALQSLYAPGASTVVLAENTVFAPISDISVEEHMTYLRKVQDWCSVVCEPGTVMVRDIADFHGSSFNTSWLTIAMEFATRYRAGDPDAVHMVSTVLPTNFKTLNYRSVQEDLLLSFFDPQELEDGSVTAALSDFRVERYRRTLVESFIYLAYHQARYRSDFMKRMFPGTFKLTVSPKIGSCGISLLNPSSKILPYYGYVVQQGATFSFHYRLDVPASAVALYCAEESLSSPFLYECR